VADTPHILRGVSRFNHLVPAQARLVIMHRWGVAPQKPYAVGAGLHFYFFGSNKSF
jgi:hypothetical protein